MTNNGQPTIAIAAGGTAGHVVPALAVADALQAKGAEVIFLGGQRAEAQLVPAAGYRLETIAVQGIPRSNPLKAARAIVQAGLATATARRILRSTNATAVLGGGGYVAGPVGVAALLDKRPLVLTEADSHLGLTNRLLAGCARHVCLSFPIAGREGKRYQVTGRPVPKRYEHRSRARAEFGVGEDERCVLIFGGSLGAQSINFAAITAFSDAPYRILHVAGKRDFSRLQAPGEHYILRDYVMPFGKALAAADVVIARAGGSVFELAQYGLPGLLIPYPHATGDHQSTNARWFERGGAAVVLSESDLTPARLRSEIDRLLDDPQRLAQMSDAALKLARPDAARRVADAVIAACQ